MFRDIQLVVARYREDLSWLKRVPAEVDVRVYNKGPECERSCIPLPNVGREAHTYLHHIVETYHDLPEWTVFCQGFPFDHEPSFHRRLQALVDGACDGVDFVWTGLFVDYDVGDGSRLFAEWSKNEGGRLLQMDRFWESLFETSAPERFVFMPGAQFAVRRNRLQSRPLSFYQEALRFSETFPDAAHCFERCWDRVLNASAIPTSVCEGTLPIYLRPVKRFGITWDTCGTIPGHPFYDSRSG